MNRSLSITGLFRTAHSNKSKGNTFAYFKKKAKERIKKGLSKGGNLCFWTLVIVQFYYAETNIVIVGYTKKQIIVRV